LVEDDEVNFEQLFIGTGLSIYLLVVFRQRLERVLEAKIAIPQEYRRFFVGQAFEIPRGFSADHQRIDTHFGTFSSAIKQ